ncbi:glycosyltransferase [Lachnospiraceae bacterium 48-42]|jgi:Predicted glycosyltransferases
MTKNVLVIIATYNGGKYLAEQLESVLYQENVNVSILVRDDASSDDTQIILNSYKDAGKLEWYTGNHLNAARSFWDLMKKCNKYDFDYVAFCDQDDVWDKDKLYVAVTHLNTIEQDTPSLYYCGQRLVDSSLDFISSHKLNRNRSLLARFVISDIAGCTAVFNKSLLKSVVKYEPKYLQMHDTWILKVCLCLGGKVFVDPDMHINYRQHSNNAIGLVRGLCGYIRLVNFHISKNHIEQQMLELKKGYSEHMVKEYKELVEYICEYRSNKKYKKKLLDFNYINFCNKGLNLTYWLKVKTNKL